MAKHEMKLNTGMADDVIECKLALFNDCLNLFTELARQHYDSNDSSEIDYVGWQVAKALYAILHDELGIEAQDVVDCLNHEMHITDNSGYQCRKLYRWVCYMPAYEVSDFEPPKTTPFRGRGDIMTMWAVTTVLNELSYRYAYSVFCSMKYATNLIEYDWTRALQIDEVSQAIFKVIPEFTVSDADFKAAMIFDLLTVNC